MTTITWSVTQMDCYPQDAGQTNVVFTVHWQCVGVDGKYQACIYSTTPVKYTAGEPYTPYAQLTQDQVLGWIWGAGVDKTATEASIQSQINNQINPPVVTPPLPWIS